MFSTTAVLAIFVASGVDGFTMRKGFTQRSTLKMAEEAWFPGSATTNLVDLEQLSSVFGKATSKAQDFLEAEPYWDTSFMPLQTYKATAPFTGKIVSVTKIVGPEATGETYDVVIDHFGKLPYWEGQSLGVIPPGINPKKW
jgi:ferredoxin--NADP+ reductase